MTELKMLQMLELYRAKVGGYVPHPEPYPHDVLLRTDWDGLQHIWHLMNLMETFIRDKQTEKAMRWLGFIQGVLWACRVYTIDELKIHNRPDDQGAEAEDPEPPRAEHPPCGLPLPPGWDCTRPAGHQGPCAAVPEQQGRPISYQEMQDMGKLEERGRGYNPIPNPPDPARFPRGTPVKILRGGPYGSDGKLGVVEGHVEDGYAVQLGETKEIIYADTVEYARPPKW